MLKSKIITMVCILLLLQAIVNVYAADKLPEIIKCVVSTDTTDISSRLLYTALQKIGIEMTVDISGEGNGIQMLKDGEYNMLAALPAGLGEYNPELIMIPEPIGSISYAAYGKKNSNLKLDSWDSLSGLRVGTLFQQYYIEMNLPEDAIQVKAATADELKASMLNDDVDVIVICSQREAGFLISDKYKALGIIQATEAYAYLNKEYEHLAEEISEALNNLKIDGTSERILLRKNESDKANVLHISSYYDDVKQDQIIKEEIREVFKNNNNIDLLTVSLNSNRVFDPNERANTAQNIIRDTYLSEEPDVIIVSDNAALDFVSEYYDILFKQIPVVFCGINGNPIEQLRKITDVSTGAFENVSADETVEQMLRLFPETKTIYVINDFSDTGMAVCNDIKSQLTRYTDTIDFIYNDPLSLDKLLEKLSQLPSDTLVLIGRMNMDSDGRYYSMSEMQQIMAASSSVPMFGLVDASYGYGQLGGKYIDARMHANFAAKVALEILNGTDVKTLPVRVDTSSFNRWIFDYNIMKKYSVNEKDLPVNSYILNPRQSFFYDRNSVFYIFLVTSIVLLLALISAGFYIFKMRESYIKQINDSKARLIADKNTEIQEIRKYLDKVITKAPLFFMVITDRVITEINDYFEKKILLAKGRSFLTNEPGYVIINEITEQLKDKTHVYGVILKFPMISGENSRFYLNMIKTEINDNVEIIIWGFNVEDSMRKIDSLEQSQNDFQKILDSMQTPVALQDLAGSTIIYANKAMVDLFGCRSKNELIGTSIERYYPEYQPDGNKSKTARLKILKHFMESNEPITYEWLYTLPERPYLYTKVAYSTFLFKNELSLFSTVFDVSAEKQRTQLLTEAAEKEREANKLKSRFLMNMSHEMRTPMNAIIGLSHIALQKIQNPSTASTLKKINTSAKNLLTIINDILDFSKIEAEKMRLIDEEFVLEDIITNAFDIAGERVGDKNVHLHLDMDDNVPYVLIGDKTRTWQIIKNVLDNSAKFTNEGTITLKVSVCRNAESNLKGQVKLNFVVEDTGCGMSKSQMERLYIPFEQFSSRPDQISIGTGLGLSITKQIVSLMNGNIEVSSELNCGTTTHMQIPFKLPNDIVTMAQYSIPIMQSTKRILVCVTDDTSLAIIKKLLSFTAVEAVITDSISDAVNIEKSTHTDPEKNGKAFDTIILDNPQIAKKINEDNKESGILLITDINDRSTVIEDKKRYINDYIERPFIPTTFYQKLFNIDTDVRLSDNAYYQFKDADVLICEDNLLNQEVAYETLLMFGITPVIVSNGKEAIDMLEGKFYDLLFMDLQMPVMNGYEATLEIRNSKRPYSEIPIVAMTANAGIEERQRCIEFGMNDHLSKPLDLQEINKALFHYLPAHKLVINNSTPDELNVKSDTPKVDVYIRTDTKPKARGVNNKQDTDYINKLKAVGVDAEQGVKRFNNKSDVYFKLLRKFAGTIADGLLNYDIMFPEGNIDEAQDKIHTLKGIAGNLSVTEVYKELVLFENLMRDMKHTNEAYMNLISVCEKVKAKILDIFI